MEINTLWEVYVHLTNHILSSFRAEIIAIDPGGIIVYIDDVGWKILDKFSIEDGKNIRSLVLCL